MVHQHGDHHEIPSEHHVSRAGAWLPADHRIQHGWLGRQIDEAKDNPKELVPCLKEFKAFIEGDSKVYMWFHSM
jgi:phosphatidylserine decarboxylase